MPLATLRRDEAAPIILQALHDRRLLRQIHRDGPCHYRSIDGHPCAIGVLVDDATAAVLDEHGTIGEAVSFDVVKVDDFEWFATVQSLHDRNDLATLEWYLKDTIAHGPRETPAEGA